MPKRHRPPKRGKSGAGSARAGQPEARERSEEALRASEKRFRSLIEHSMDVIAVLDAGGWITYASPAVGRVLGYGPGDLVGRLSFDFLHPDEASRIRAAFSRALHGDAETVRREFRFRHADGSWKSFEALVTNLLAEPAVAGLVINARDVTEGREAEETLRQERFLMHTLMERVPDPIYFKDSQGRFLRANRAMAFRCGLSDPAQLVGRTDFDLFARDHAAAAFRDEQEIMRTGEPLVNLEERETWPSRPDAWVSTTKMPLRDAGGAIIGTFGISRDVTERRRAEEALRRSEAEYRSLVEHAPLGIYRSTREGRFLTVNPALVAMLGYRSGEELIGLDIGREIYEDPQERARLVARMAGAGEATVETRWKRRDGSVISIRLRLRPVLRPGGLVECYEGTVEDVTEHRRLEAQFRQAQRLEAVGRLAGGVAHDFNNVLTAITGYSELLLEGLRPSDPKRQDIQEIRAAAQRAATLTRQLLAFSRKQVLQTRVLDLNDVVRTLEKMLRRLIGEDIKLDCVLAEPLGAVRADPGQLEQVILNLAVNARDAMPDGGRLTIETANVTLDEEYARTHPGATPGPHALLAVTDTGTGMDAETQAHIFEPFFTTKEAGKGTGLGLATVYGIVKQSGGHVWAYSEAGRGATFKIYLPEVDAPVERLDQTEVERPTVGGRETVLVVEDDPGVREIVSQALSQRGYSVLRSPGGQAALQVASGHRGRIDLLVTDLVMPGMTGREVAEALSAARAGVRVLYMSGYTDDAVVRHGVLEAGTNYLQKPFTAEQLARKVREVLDAAGGGAVEDSQGR